MREGFHGERSIVLPKMILDMIAADRLADALHITDIGYYPHATKHFRKRHEGIGQYVLIYCTDGKGWYEVNGVRHEVCADHYFILPSGVPHCYGADSVSPWTIYWIHFGGSLAQYYAAGAELPQPVGATADSRIFNRMAMFDEIYSRLDSGFDMESIRYAISLFHHYLGSLRFVREYRRGAERGSDGNLVDCVVHYMKECIGKSLTLAQLSQYAGVSASYLSAQFKRATGHSPLSYYNLLKIRYSCELIDNTPMKLNRICCQVGIDDPYYFSRLFTKIMGMSPTAYRSRFGRHASSEK